MYSHQKTRPVLLVEKCRTYPPFLQSCNHSILHINPTPSLHSVWLEHTVEVLSHLRLEGNVRSLSKEHISEPCLNRKNREQQKLEIQWNPPNKIHSARRFCIFLPEKSLSFPVSMILWDSTSHVCRPSHPTGSLQEYPPTKTVAACTQSGLYGQNATFSKHQLLWATWVCLKYFGEPPKIN